jgi:hypothetical protein
LTNELLKVKIKLRYTINFFIGLIFLSGLIILIYSIFAIWEISWLGILLLVLFGGAFRKSIFTLPYEVIALIKIWRSSSPKELSDHYTILRSSGNIRLILKEIENEI